MRKRKKTGRRFLLFIILVSGIVILWNQADVQRIKGKMSSWLAQLERNARIANIADRSWSEGAGELNLRAGAAILIDAETGNVLFKKNENKKVYPASTTKILTALIAIELGDLEELITVGDETLAEDEQESRAGLRKGDQLTLHGLIVAMMLPSGNDAARAIAVHLARQDSNSNSFETRTGSYPTKVKSDNETTGELLASFSKMMNKRAQQLGAKDSSFQNPHGLHDRKHYSTAKDLALIAQEAMKHEIFRSIAQAEYYNVMREGERAQELTYSNRNQLLQTSSPHYFAGATGIKTGFTDEAGYCLVSSAQKEGRAVISVVLHSTAEEVWSDSQQMLSYGFQQLSIASALR